MKGENGGRHAMSFCENGGKDIPNGQKVSENIYLCADGKYRWTYEFDMLRNPVLLITTWKVMALSFGIVIVIMLLVTLFGGDLQYWDAEDFLGSVRGFLIFLVVLLAVTLLAYLIVAKSYGWKYMVLFTMDENGVEHRQMKKQFEKAQALGWLTAAAGALAGNAGQAGAGILAATRDTLSSEFASVGTVRSNRRRHTIYVNQGLFHNQVYAADADFDFVRGYIIRHCINAKHVS